MPVYGSEVELSITYQNSIGTIADVANSGNSIAVINESFNAQQPLLNSESIRNRVDRGDAYAGAKEITGEIECEAVPHSIGWLLRSALNRTGSVNSDSLYSHTLEPYQPSTDLYRATRPISLVKKWGSGANDIANYYNLFATGFEMSCAAGEFLKIKIPYIGGRNDGGTTDFTASYPAHKPFTWDQSSITIGGNAHANIKSFSISVDESLESKYTLSDSGDQWPNRVSRSGFRTSTINLGLSFDNSSEYIAFRGDAATPPPLAQGVKINFEQSVEVQSGYNHRLFFEAYDVKWESLEHPVSGVGEIELSLTGKIKYDNSNAKPFYFTLVDTHASY